MSHLSIAIIRKKIDSKATSKVAANYGFLVQFTPDGEHMFFDVRNMAIGGGFDYGNLTKAISSYFELVLPNTRPSIETENKRVSDFEEYTLFAENRDPAATSYLFTLSELQVESIQKSIEENSKDEKWKYLKWIKQDDLQQYKDSWKKEQKFIFEITEPFDSPRFTNEMKSALRNILTARNHGKLVVFAGAGVSVDSLVPAWSDLTQGLQGDLDLTEIDDLKLAELYYKTHGNKEFQERVQSILKFGKTRYNPLHEKIVDISPLHIVTTNFDDHFEQVHNERGFKYSIVKCDSDLPYSTSESLYVKMHGDLGQRNIVLTANEFDNYETRFPLIDGFIKGVFASKLVLFVGFSFDDPNLIRIRKWVGKILEKESQKPYVILDTVQNERKEVLEKDNELKVIDIGIEKTKRAINKYFSQIASEDEKSQVKKLKSLKSKTLYKFLSVVNEYDPIPDSLEVKPMAVQFQNSMERFIEFDNIPQSTLEHIYPFKVKGPPINEKLLRARLEYNELETPNESFLQYLEEISDDNGVIKFHSYSDDSKKFSQQQLDRIWKLLYNSGAHTFKRKNDTSSKKYKLEPIRKEGIQCECSRCLIERCEFDQLLSELNKVSDWSICNHSSSSLDLTQAYGFFKSGYVVKCYYALEEVKVMAWKSRQYVKFFITCYNQKKLRPFLWYSNAKLYDDIELDTINQRIDKMDLNKLLTGLPVDKDVRQALSVVMDESMHDYTASFVEEKLSKILDVYKGYQENRYYDFSGPNYWYMATYQIGRLWSFYNRNNLFTDDSAGFRQIIHKYHEIILASYSISDEYSGKLKLLFKFFAETVLYHATPEEFQKLLVKYEVTNLKFRNAKDFRKDFKTSFVKFLESGYNESNFFKRHIDSNDTYETAVKNSNIFSNRTKRTFSNFSVLSAHIDFSDSDINEIVDKSICYLEVSNNFQFIDSLKHWEYFITKKITKISEKNIKRLIDYLLSGKPNGFGTAATICFAIVNDKKYDSFLDKENVAKIADKYQNKYDRKALFAFYPLLNKDAKKAFYKTVKKDLIKEDNSFKVQAYYSGVWTPIENEEIFDSFVKNIELAIPTIPDYEINENGNVIDIYDFSSWNSLVNLAIWVNKYKLYDDKRILDLVKSINSNFFKWILDPVNYDYKIFNINWLSVFKLDNWIDILKNIEPIFELIENELLKKYNKQGSEFYFKLLDAKKKI